MAFQLFTGTFESTLDDKGRVVIPAPLRERYDGELVIMLGNGFYARIMTGKDFMKFKEIWRKWPLSPEEKLAYQYLESTAKVTEVDKKTGRIPIPSAIRSYASLSKDCLVVSINECLEIWNAETYHAHMREIQQTVKESMKRHPMDFSLKEGEDN